MDQYRVFGNPIAQSKSPFIHQSFAEQTQQNLNYQSQLAQVNDFKQAVRALIANNGKGANVTAPFKEQAYELADQLSERALKAGAVNTLTFKDGKILGDTTDGIGLVADLYRHEVILKDKTILLLGAGGAAKGVVSSLLQESPLQLIIANRTVNKAQAIGQQYPAGQVQAISFEELTEVKADIIINATSAGLSGSKLPISNAIFQHCQVCYDMVYGKSLTPFLQLAGEQGVEQVIDGLGMLVEQAAESFAIWRGVRPETKAVYNALREQLASS
ncbi:MAG: shikimate dehydrogenase [Cognaticolwellia aestuarii]